MESEILAAVIGAGVALISVFFAQISEIIRAIYGDSQAKKEIRRAKLEELSDCVHKTTAWIRETVDLHYDPSIDAYVPLCASAHRAHVLALLYFEDLQPDVQRLLVETTRFHSAVVSNPPESTNGRTERENTKRSIKYLISELDKSCAKAAKKLI